MAEKKPEKQAEAKPEEKPEKSPEEAAKAMERKRRNLERLGFVVSEKEDGSLTWHRPRQKAESGGDSSAGVVVVGVVVALALAAVAVAVVVVRGRQE